ncbi:duplicated orphan permease [Bryocella elongata]|uniref:Duplicated orphan permease n=2 Tax=Bryocella elongata TaxID=863522 RepID=A0A1H5Z4F2_9BACT|nr:duplicated orphan permease [Bryocella elongata]
MMSSILQDLRFTLRQLRKSPGFAITAVLTLALGIGANTSIFTLVHAVLLRNLPVADPKTLLRLGDREDCCALSGIPPHDSYSLFPWELYKHLQASAPEFEQLAAMQSYPWKMTVLSNRPGDYAQGVPVSFVSGNYFETFGLSPFAGRLLTPADDQPEAIPVAVISYQTWQRDYGSDLSIVGKTFLFKTHPVTIVGIAPAGFYGERMIRTPANFYLPFSLEPTVTQTSLLHNRSTNWIYLLGRLKPGVATGPLQEKISASLRQWLGDNVDIYQRADARHHLDASHITLTPGGAGIASMQAEYRSGLSLLMAISGLVLLIACANLANLMLVRAIARSAETSLRMALGAQRTRILRQMLTESLTLSILGGGAGLALAYAGTKMLLLLAFPNSPGLPISATPSLPVFTFALVITMLTAIAFGLAPAWITTMAQPAEALRSSTRTTRSHASWLQRSLVVVQAALSLMLLVGAGLLSKSLARLEHQDFGFTTENRYVIHMDPESAGYKPGQLQGLYDEVERRFRAIPGVDQVGLSSYSPLEGDSWGEDIFLNGRPEPGSDQSINSRWLRVSPEMLDLVGEAVIQGRSVTANDTAAAPGIAVVNQAFVRKFFHGGENPIGARFGTNGMTSTNDFTIVGVVKDAKWEDPSDDVAPRFFRPLLQLAASDPQGETRSLHTNTIMLRTRGEVAGLESEARRILASINPNLPVTYYSTFADQIASQFTQQRLLARLALLFSLLALLLAAIGLYGVTAYMVARRTAEIGIRMALGARRVDALWLVLKRGIGLACAGLVLGLVASAMLTRLLASLLFQVAPLDPVTFAETTVLLLSVACFACLLPAYRASRVNPNEALRSE